MPERLKALKAERDEANKLTAQLEDALKVLGVRHEQYQERIARLEAALRYVMEPFNHVPDDGLTKGYRTARALLAETEAPDA